MRHLEDIDDLGKEILQKLRGRKEGGLTTREIRDAIEEDMGGDYRVKGEEVRNQLGELIERGDVKAYTKKDGKVKYYLSKGIGSGYRSQKKLQGRDFFYNISKMYERILGSIFILFGLGFFIYQNSSMSGAVISNSTSMETSFIVSFCALALGGFLLFKSFKK